MERRKRDRKGERCKRRETEIERKRVRLSCFNAFDMTISERLFLPPLTYTPNCELRKL